MDIIKYCNNNYIFKIDIQLINLLLDYDPCININKSIYAYICDICRDGYYGTIEHILNNHHSLISTMNTNHIKNIIMCAIGHHIECPSDPEIVRVLLNDKYICNILSKDDLYDLLKYYTK